MISFAMLSPTEVTTTNAAIGGAYVAFRCFGQMGKSFYALPSTQFVVDKHPGSGTSSPYVQRKLSSSILQNLVQGNKDVTVILEATQQSEGYPNLMPYCIIAHMDSVTVILDTRANHVIVNKKELLTNF